MTQSYNLSEDGTASGTGSLTNKLASDQFVSVTSGSEDLHLKAGADAIDAGTSLAGSFSDDIDSDSRPQGSGWDIGADEYFSGATPTPSPTPTATSTPTPTATPSTCLATIVNTGNATNYGSSGTAASITHGLTINSGDVVVALIAANATGTTIMDNNGANAFTQAIQENTPASGGTMRYAIYYRVAGASEPLSYAWTLGSSQSWTIVIRVFSGVDTTSVWDVAPSVSTRTGSSSNGTTATAPSMTTGTAGAVGIAAFFTDGNGTTYSGPTNGYGTLIQQGGGRSVASAIRTWATAGSTGTTSATLSPSDDWAAHQFALRPATVSCAPTSTPTPTATPTATATSSGVVSVDTTTSGQTTGGSSMTISHTTSGTNRLMLVGISINNDGSETVTSVTWKGTENLSLVDTVANGDDARVEIWQLVGPSTGTGDVVINFSASLEQGAVAGVTTFAGVNQSTPLGTFASAVGNNSSPATVDIPSAAGELVFGVVCIEYEPVITGPGQAQLWNRTNTATTGEVSGAGSTEAGAGPTVTTSWTIADPTYEHWAVGGVSIKP